MKKANNNTEEILDDRSWAVNLLTYDYSEATLISDDTLITLLSDERRRLTNNETRFQLFNEHGELYIDGANVNDFESKFFKRITENKPRPLSQDTPNLRIIIDLINEIHKIGLRVVGARQIRHESWDCIYDNAIDDLKGHDISLKKIDLSKDYSWDRVFYDVLDSNNKSVLKQIPENILGSVLLGLLLQIKPFNLKRLLLFPKISSDIAANTNTRLRLESHYRSDFREVNSISDIKLLENMPIKKDADHILKKFQFLNSKNNLNYGGPFEESDARDALIYVSYDIPDTSKDDAKKFSDWLIRAAKKAHVYIKRSERRQNNSYLVKHYTVKDNTIKRLVARSQLKNPEYNHETVFEIFDSSTEESIKYDLSLGELATYLLSLLIKKKF